MVADEASAREVFSPKEPRSASFQRRKVHPLETEDAGNTETAARPPSVSIRTVRRRLFLLKLTIGTAVCHCVLLTLWLILLNLKPNDTINRVMGTGKIDDESFWLLVDTPPALVIVATLGLSILALCYVTILFKLIRTQPVTSLGPRSPTKAPRITQQVGEAVNNAVAKRASGRVLYTTVQVAAALTRTDSRAHKMLKLWGKIADLVIESVILYKMLQAGSPGTLVGVFTAVVGLNALSCAVMMFLPNKNTVLIETLVDIAFDLIVVIVFPVFVLLYCLATFNLDRAQIHLNMEVFPQGWFERAGRIMADPAQTMIIDTTLKSLRILSVLDFFTHIGMNSTLCYRLHSAVKLINDPQMQRGSVYPKRHKPAAAFFALFSLCLTGFVAVSVRTSSNACEPHPECAMHAWTWTVMDSGSLTDCPCLILIDRDVAPKSYAEWMQPKDVTEKVSQLASTGKLQALLLTNRYMPVLPEELRDCTNMKHLSLEYTHTQVLPPWTREFTKLEFIHVENKMHLPMLSLPDTMFNAMSSLTFIHFSFVLVTQLPSFDGLSNLRSITFAVFLALEELPSFSHLHHLERIVISCAPMLHTLPDFANVKNLKSFVVLDRGEWCCNGFLGDCDLQNPLCQPHPVWGSPAATCLPIDRPTAIASPATLAAVGKFRSTVCGPVLRPEGLDGPPRTRAWTSAMGRCGNSAMPQAAPRPCATTSG